MVFVIASWVISHLLYRAAQATTGQTKGADAARYLSSVCWSPCAVFFYFVQTTVVMLGTANASEQSSLQWLQVRCTCSAAVLMSLLSRSSSTSRLVPRQACSCSWCLTTWLQPDDSTAPVCFAPLTPYEKMAMNTLIPFVLGLQILLTMLVHATWHWQRNRSRAEHQKFDVDPYLRTFCSLFIFSTSRVILGRACTTGCAVCRLLPHHAHTVPMCGFG